MKARGTKCDCTAPPSQAVQTFGHTDGQIGAYTGVGRARARINALFRL